MQQEDQTPIQLEELLATIGELYVQTRQQRRIILNLQRQARDLLHAHSTPDPSTQDASRHRDPPDSS